MKNLEEYLEVHYDIVEFTSEHLTAWKGDDAWSIILKRYEERGRGGMYELSKEWTDIFMQDYENIEWGVDLEYYDTIEDFCQTKNYED